MIQDKEWDVSYDIFGANREVPLYQNSKRVRASSAGEAINIVKKLVGGRNHKAAPVLDDQLTESASKFNQKVEQAANAFASGRHKNAKQHLDNARTYMLGLNSTEMSKVDSAYKTYKKLRAAYAGSGGEYTITDNQVGNAKVVTPANPGENQKIVETYVGRETKDGTWRVFKTGSSVAVAGPFNDHAGAADWIKKQTLDAPESFSQMSDSELKQWIATRQGNAMAANLSSRRQQQLKQAEDELHRRKTAQPKKVVETGAQYVGKFKKGSDYFSLWDKGNHWYELTYASQSGKGFEHVDEWYMKTLGEIQRDLNAKGYEPVSTSKPLVSEANKFTASSSDQYKVGDKVETFVGGKWYPGVITKPPHEETKNYGVRFSANRKTHHIVSSLDQLRPLKESVAAAPLTFKQYLIESTLFAKTDD